MVEGSSKDGRSTLAGLQPLQTLISMKISPKPDKSNLRWGFYCRVCGWEVCYTEYAINNWISVVPLAADPLIGLRSFLFPAMPDMCPFG
jgi:hypothetical protein